MTALRLDSESLGDENDRRRIEADVDALQRSVDDIIRTAGRPLHEDLVVSCDAAAVVTDRLAFWSVLAEEQGRTVTVAIADADADVRVALAPDDLAACLDALLGNVFAHTGDGVGFSVAVHPGLDDLVHVVVADEGAGLPHDDGRLHERGVSGSGSTGLGLDIARRAATASGGRARDRERAWRRHPGGAPAGSTAGLISAGTGRARPRRTAA